MQQLKFITEEHLPFFHTLLCVVFKKKKKFWLIHTIWEGWLWRNLFYTDSTDSQQPELIVYCYVLGRRVLSLHITILRCMSIMDSNLRPMTCRSALHLHLERDCEDWAVASQCLCPAHLVPVPPLKGLVCADCFIIHAITDEIGGAWNMQGKE